MATENTATRRKNTPFDARREELKGSVLCLDHMRYYNLTAKDVAIDPCGPGGWQQADPGAPVECECCALAIMKAAGAV